MIRLLLLCALMLGMRRGEIVALQWSDINYAEMYISITKSAYKVKGQPQRVKAPKSQCGTRTVYFTASFVQVLDEWRTEQSQIKSQAGDKWNEQDFIFTNAVGGMMNLYSPTSICSDFEARNGLHHLKLHGLRHTCGSLMVSNGVDPETVKNMLGHESLETTNMYIHPYATNMKKAAELLSEVITK